MKHINVALFVPHAGCPHRCSFCDQNAISGKCQPLTAADVASAAETAIRAGAGGKNGDIAFFGGSFTAIDRDYMEELLRAAQPYLQSGEFAGIRISTRPDAIDEDVLSLLKSYGVRAIELGCQSMNNAVLLQNKRGHTAEDTKNAAFLIRRFGFELGVQMMTGLPGDSDETAILTAKELIALSPATVRIYPTLVLAGTKLASLYEEDKYQPQSLDEAVSLCAKLLELFEESGVRVIRMGLHAQDDLERSFLAGPYHPAFRELCESKIYFDRACALLADKEPGAYQLKIAPHCLSKALGQKKQNQISLAKQGYSVTFTEEPALQGFEIEL